MCVALSPSVRRVPTPRLTRGVFCPVQIRTAAGTGCFMMTIVMTCMAFTFIGRPGMDDIQTDLFYDYRTNVASYVHAPPAQTPPAPSIRTRY